MWKQDVTPDLDDSTMTVSNGGKVLKDWLGYCLAVVRTSFSAPAGVPTARASWDGNTTKHADQSWPLNVYFPIYYSWVSGGVDYGHVVTAHWDGTTLQIWSAPYTHKPYFDRFTNDLNLGGHYGKLVFLGWAESVNGKRVIHWEADPAPAHPYTVEAITPKQVASSKPVTEWNLDAQTWPDFKGVGTLAANTPVTVVAIANHKLGGSYYMPDTNKSEGYNVVDVQDYTPPKEEPSEPPTQVPDTPVTVPDNPTPTEPAEPQIPSQPTPEPGTPDLPAEPDDGEAEPKTTQTIWEAIINFLVSVIKKLFKKG